MEQLLGVADAARILGVVPATVRQMERDGRLPAMKTAGGVRVFRQGDVERLAAERSGRASMPADKSDRRPVDGEEVRP